MHAKSAGAQEVRALLVGRKLLQAKLLDVELSIRGILRGSFPTEDAASKLIYLAIRNFEKGGRNVREWFAARNQFAALATEAALPWSFVRTFLGPVGLLPARGRQAGIVRPLWRFVQPRLQLRDPSLRSGKSGRQFRVPALSGLQCFPERVDQRVFLGMR